MNNTNPLVDNFMSGVLRADSIHLHYQLQYREEEDEEEPFPRLCIIVMRLRQCCVPICAVIETIFSLVVKYINSLLVDLNFCIDAGLKSVHLLFD